MVTSIDRIQGCRVYQSNSSHETGDPDDVEQKSLAVLQPLPAEKQLTSMLPRFLTNSLCMHKICSLTLKAGTRAALSLHPPCRLQLTSTDEALDGDNAGTVAPLQTLGSPRPTLLYSTSLFNTIFAMWTVKCPPTCH